MKKTIRTVICIALCVVMTAVLASPAFAENEKTAFIVVSGMETFPLYDADGTEIYPFPSDTIKDMVGRLLDPIGSFLLTRDCDAFADSALPVLRDAFGTLACSADGESVRNVSTDIFNCSFSECSEYFIGKDKDEEGIVCAGAEKFGAENTFFFNYDWRLDPLTHAEELNKFIKNVRQTTGCGRIALAAFSMGGAVTCSYLYKYGSSEVDSVLLCSTAFQGTSCMGSLFTGDIELDASGLFKRLAQLTRNDFLENFVEYINELLTLSGFNGSVSDFVNDIFNGIGDRIYSELLIPVFGYMPGLWSLVDDKNFEDAKEFMLDSEKNAKLISRIDEYNTCVQDRAEEILRAACRDTAIYILAQYNMQGLPVSQTATYSNNDYLIDACYASGGAICSRLGETLGDGYVQKINDGHNYLSADGQIDASTCMFPDRTWFIRDMGHVDYPCFGGSELVLYLASSKGQLTVFDSEYPQFMTYSYDADELSPVSEMEESFSDKLFDFLTDALRLVFALLTGKLYD